MTREELNKLIMQACERTWNEKTCKEIEQALSQEPCTDAVSREWLKKKLQEHHDFFVNAYGGFKNMPQTDKARVDEITHHIRKAVRNDKRRKV